jgi:predicted DNA-binding transcriptional regulator YafY
MARGEHAIKAIRILKYLEERNHLGSTVDEISERFKISRRSAYRYLEFIELAGLHLAKKRIDGRVYFRIKPDC